MWETHKVLFCACVFFYLFNTCSPLARSLRTMIFLLTPTLIISKCNFEHFGYSYQLSGSWKVLGTSQLAKVSTSQLPLYPFETWNSLYHNNTTLSSWQVCLPSLCGSRGKGEGSLFSLLPFWGMNEEVFFSFAVILAWKRKAFLWSKR